jgi:hypothetical protein
MAKKDFPIAIVMVLVILGVIFLPKLLFSISPVNYTGYIHASYSKNSITYTGLDINTLTQSGFTGVHFASGDLGQYFEVASKNQGFWVFYLEFNGINSNDFNGGGDGTYCVFSPKVIDDTKWRTELENLGFVYYPYAPTNNHKMGCYQGNYISQKINEIASKLNCYVEGKVISICSGEPLANSDGSIKTDRCNTLNEDYKIEGTTSYSEGSGFVCTVDSDKIFNEIPRTFVRNSDGETKNVEKMGIDGAVVFTTESVNVNPNPVTCDENNDCVNNYKDCYYICSQGTCNKINTLIALKPYPDCSMFQNQTICTMDVKQCSDGSYVGRDPNRNCLFKDCPSEGTCSFVSKFDIIHFTTDKCQNGLIFLLVILLPTVLSLLSLLKRK